MNLSKVHIKRFKKLLTEILPESPSYEEVDEPQLTFVCPFCEGGPSGKRSFAINTEDGLFRCFRRDNCNRSGNSAQLYAAFRGCSVYEAYRYLNGTDEMSFFDMANAIRSVPDDDVFSNKVDDTDFFVECEEVENFKSSEFLPVVREWIERQRGYDWEQFISQHDLFIPDQDGEHAGRVGFRIWTDENMCYLLYRVVDDPSMKKTWNAPGNYHSRCLYNYDNVANSDEGFVILTEGIFDCARLMSYGLPAVALFGVDLSEYQAYLLSKLSVDRIFFALDYGTEDHVLRNIETLKLISERKIDTYHIVFENPGEDPDNVSPETLMHYLKKAMEKN